MTAPRVFLKTRERFELQTLVREEYPIKGLTDPEFAAYAAEKLANPGINENHVAGARKDFEIPATRDLQRNAHIANAGLEARVTRIEEWLHKNFASDWRKFEEGGR